MMDRESKKMENQSNAFNLCKNQCGFYGSALYDGLCCKCHEKLSSQNDYRGSLYSNMTCRSAAKNIPQRIGETPLQSDVEECNSLPCELAENECNSCCNTYESVNSETPADNEQIPDNVENEQPAPAEPQETPKKTETPSDLCFFCSKKLAVNYVKCKCENYYCFKHRQPEDHECTFDYKKIGKMIIQKNNPRVAFDKIRKL